MTLNGFGIMVCRIVTLTGSKKKKKSMNGQQMRCKVNINGGSYSTHTQGRRTEGRLNFIDNTKTECGVRNKY